MSDKRISFTAADVIPMKLFLIGGLVDQIKSGYIPPVHISLSPTNRCNQNCNFCSYSERDRKLEMSLDKAERIIWSFRMLGAKAVDLTGGGEPLMYPHIEELVRYIRYLDMKISLTTNGLLLDKHRDIIPAFTWIRVSVSDYSDEAVLVGKGILQIIRDYPSVDWNLSYVATRRPNYGLFALFAEFANVIEQITHVRVVSDLLDLHYLPSIEIYKSHLRGCKIDDSKVIYQDRHKYSLGAKKCLISLLRPNVDAKGDVFPCCGTQYAVEDNPARDFAPGFNMGHDYQDIWKYQRYFDGGVCTKCYYYGYNEVLNVLQSKEVRHIEFV